ncbi:MAG TPA: hypothetical protein EYQ85_06495 [Candidatus Poseidoniales archaeon]|nr:hypothetical protein [Candidatus Poseidoniales archaeon]
MSRVRATSLSLILTAMMLIGSAVAPIAQAQAVPTEAPESVLFGIGYEWSNYDNDINALTGISLENILVDVMKAATDSGIELVLAEVTSGSSSVIIEQYDGDSTTWDVDGTSVDLTMSHTDVFVRHGILVDTAVITSWSDDRANWDLIYSIDSQQLYTLDVEYVEYIDADGLLYGMDLQLSMNSQQTLEIDFLGEIGGDDATLPFNIQLDAMVNYEIDSLTSEVRLGEPSPIHNYVSSDYAEVEWECGNDNMDSSVQMEWEDVRVRDNCDSFTGDYSTSSHYSLALSGIPAEDVGMEADELDISIADQFSDNGHFDEDEIEFEGYIGFGDFLQDVIIDETGTEVLAVEMFGAPFSITMPSVVAYSTMNAVMGSGTSPTMWDAIVDELEFLDDIDGGEAEEEEGTYICDNGEEIPSHWVNDGFEDCADGSDEGVDEGEGGDDDTYTCDNGEEIPREYVNNGYEDCEDGSDEGVDEGEGGGEDCYDENGNMEPCDDEGEGPDISERLETIITAFSESTIESTMEAFGDNLEDRLSNYEEDLAYVDANARLLWSEELGKCVGFQIIVADEDEYWYTLVGPESDVYNQAPISTSIEYIIGGSTAEDEIILMESEDSLDDLVDESVHDVTDVNDALRGAGVDIPVEEEEEEVVVPGNETDDTTIPDEKDDSNESAGDAEKLASEGGFVPFVSPLATIGIIALAGLAISRKRDKPFA